MTAILVGYTDALGGFGIREWPDTELAGSQPLHSRLPDR